MTLVEVVVGAALIGVLLSLVVLASSRFSVQSHRSADRAEACAIADKLIEEWWGQSDAFPRNSKGDCLGRAGWRWRTSDVKDDDLKRDLGAQVIAVEVFAPGQPDNAPSARVEMLYPEADRAQ